MNLEQSEKKSVTFARLPIFDARKNLWGYEVAYMPEENSNITPTGHGSLITADVLSGSCLVLEKMMDKTKKILVAFSQKNILDNLPYALPPGRTVVKLTDPDVRSDPLLEELSRLKQNGYQIASAWNRERNTCQAVFELSDMTCLDISGYRLPDLTGICNKTISCDTVMLADQVDDQTGFDVCKNAGFSFFQGSFFKQPENICVKQMAPATFSRFQLMEAIEKQDPDFSKLATAIQTDVTISFRLLSHLNSASFGFRRKIESIKDAITMLGWQNLKNWLRVIVLSEVSQNQHAPELIFLSAQRGKFLEQVGLEHDFWGFEPDSLFLLGMFSLLDALLNKPMDEIVTYLPLADKLKGALCMETNNEYVPFLKLARCLEEAKFEHGDAMINRLGLDPAKIKHAYYRSVEWAGQLSQQKS